MEDLMPLGWVIEVPSYMHIQSPSYIIACITFFILVYKLSMLHPLLFAAVYLWFSIADLYLLSPVALHAEKLLQYHLPTLLCCSCLKK